MVVYDAIVIGVGGMGSSTAWHLARSGCKVLGLEQFGLPNSLGSSYGSTRIIRLAYPEGSEYVPLLKAAYRYWRELEEATRADVMQTTGALDIGTDDSWTVRGSRTSCVEHGIAFEDLSAAEVNSRFPGYSLPNTMRAIYQPDGGYLQPEWAVVVFAFAARNLGAEFHVDECVHGWSRTPKGIQVTTSKGEYRARKLVVAAGPWTGKLCPALRRHCVPQRQVVLWTEPKRPEEFSPERFPVFNLEAPSGRYYGCPNHTGEGFKIGKYNHLRQTVSDPDSVDRECRAEDEAVLREGIRGYFPLADGATRRMSVCMFTNSPDSDFILDRMPGMEDVFVAAGFSGHGFKFCSVVGRIMADFCLEKDPPWDIQRFSLSRFNA